MMDLQEGLRLLVLLAAIFVEGGWSADTLYDWTRLDLPVGHMPFFFTNNPSFRELCQKDPECPYQGQLNETRCWGYETKCPEERRLSQPVCPESSRGWTSSKKEQLKVFWSSADFGYVKEKRGEMKTLCKPEQEGDSSLECVKYLRFCRAKNIFFDFQNAEFPKHNNRYREDVLKQGDVGGKCSLDKKALRAEGEHKSPLQSWYAEFEHFTEDPDFEKKCDVYIEKPALVIKLDATVNLFHHFCDYVNLFVSLHANNSFSLDLQIVIWDTGNRASGNFFGDTWKAFSRHPIMFINSFDKKRVCFRDAVFSFLARMRYGLYYNMPLIDGCYGSSMIRAFNEFLIHRLRIPQHGPLKDKIRITFQVRTTKYRQVLNRDEIIKAMKTVGEFELQVEEYSWNTPFLKQLEISQNSDILIGMHGAGLTHMLFQPHWGAVFEIYNCGDPSCYFDLSRLRGLRYLTWEKKDKVFPEDEGHHPTLGAHEKFTNYEFDVTEFMRLVYKAAEHVRNHPLFIAARKAKYGSETSHDEL